SDIVRTQGQIAGEKAKLDPKLLAAAVAGGAAPYLAELIHKATTTTDANGKEVVNVEANLIAHAVLGAAGEYIAQQLYPGVDRADLSEEERQTISALGTLAAGLAGGLAGGSAGGAVTGAQAGKNAVENNWLSSKQIDAWSAEMKSCQAGGADCGGIIKKYEELSTTQQKQLISDCATNPTTCQQKYGDVLADSMAVKHAIDRAMGEDIPIKMVYDLTATWAHQMDADGIVASNKMSEQVMAKYGLDQAQADIIAGVALSALGGVSKGSKLPTAAAKNIVIVDPGKKGAWNKTLNKPEPNTVYQVDGNKTYHTDDLSRTTKVNASLSLSKNDRNTYQQCKAGKCGNNGDEGGHLIASIFNGPGEKLNIFPMDGNLNKSQWKKMENSWGTALKEGKTVDVNIQPIYSGNNIRPDRVIVQYSVDGGRPVNVDFKNSPGGK
ncbi:DNA/RNA non-specific endonuclease, partial [Erwinia sp. ACCC 02193]